jgi:hypothetical protein
MFPWAGSFKRGDKVPNGWTTAAFANVESYASVMDIKITNPPSGGSPNAGKSAYVDKQDVYSAAMKDQMDNNFQVNVDAFYGGQNSPAPTAPVSNSRHKVSAAPASNTVDGVITTVTRTVTVAPTTFVTTVVRTVQPGDVIVGTPAATDPAETTVTLTTHVTPSKPSSSATGKPDTCQSN